jgi:hypothetical protein
MRGWFFGGHERERTTERLSVKGTIRFEPRITRMIRNSEIPSVQSVKSVVQNALGVGACFGLRGKSVGIHRGRLVEPALASNLSFVDGAGYP